MTRPYTAASAQVVDFGHTVWVLYIPDAEQAKDPRKVAENLTAPEHRDVEMVATATRLYKSQGAAVSGWIIDSNGSHGSEGYPNKRAMREALGYAITEYFPAPEVRAAALEAQEQQEAPSAPQGAQEQPEAPQARYTVSKLGRDYYAVRDNVTSLDVATTATPQAAQAVADTRNKAQQAPQAAAAPQQAPQAPVTVHVDWTHREGTKLTGIMLFSLSAAEEALTGREPQFLLDGGVRRKTMSAFNDYNGEDQFNADGRLEDVVARAAAWLGLQDRELAIKVKHEWRI